MRYKKSTVIILLAAMCAAPCAWPASNKTPASEFDFDLSDLGLAEPKQAEAKEEQLVKSEGMLAQLKTHAKFNLRLNYSHFLTSVNRQIDNMLYSVLSLDTHTKLKPNLTLYINGFVNYTNEANALQGAFTWPGAGEHKAKYVDFSQLNVKYNGSNYDIVLGKALINNKTDANLSVTNYFNAYSYAIYQNPMVLGRWQLRGNYYHANDEWSLVFLPESPTTNQISVNSRWYPGGFAELINLPAIPFIATKLPIDYQKPASYGYLLKYKKVNPSFDYYLDVYYGPSKYTVASIQPYKLILTKPTSTALMGGFSTVKGSWKIYGETLYQYTHHRDDDSFIQQLLGVSYREFNLASKLGFIELQPAIEVTHEYVTAKPTAASLFISSGPTHLNANSLLASLQLKKSDKLDFLLGFDYDYDRHGAAYLAGAHYTKSDNLSFQLGYVHYRATRVDSTSIFRLWEDNANILLQMNYKF